MLMTNKRILGIYDILLILGVVLCNVVYSSVSGVWDALGMTAAFAGILCVVLAAKGSIWNYLFGIVQVSLYAWVSFKSEAYGNAAVNALYYFPMQFVGWWQWRRRGAGMSSEDSSAVKARRLDTKMRIALTVAVAAATVATAFVLKAVNDAQPFVDAFTTVLCVAAQALMTFAFVEQWVLWIVFNVFTVIMWSVFAASGTPHSVPMLIMYIFYLLNSVNGLIVWIRLSASEKM